MSCLRQILLPFLLVLVFGIALLAVSARIFLPNDLAAPAPLGLLDTALPTTPATHPIWR